MATTPKVRPKIPSERVFDDEVVAHMLVAVAPDLGRAIATTLTTADPDPRAAERTRRFAREIADSLQMLEEMGRQ